MNDLISFCEKFEIDKFTIKIYDRWVVSLRPLQPTLGCLVLSARYYRDRIGLLSQEDTLELATVFSDIEFALNSVYRPDKINYLALMMVDKHVHFHVIPRYERGREIFGRLVSDYCWPKPSDLRPLDLNPIEIDAIMGALIEAFDR